MIMNRYIIERFLYSVLFLLVGLIAVSTLFAAAFGTIIISIVNKNAWLLFLYIPAYIFLAITTKPLTVILEKLLLKL